MLNYKRSNRKEMRGNGYSEHFLFLLGVQLTIYVVIVTINHIVFYFCYDVMLLVEAAFSFVQ